MHDAVFESALIEELQVDALATGQGGLASTDDHGPDEQWHSSTSPALMACAARCAPPTVRSLVAEAFRTRIEAGSKRCSSRVFAVGTAARVVE
jgi:hypothetical protein